MIVITREFKLFEEYGICFFCTAAADYGQVRDVIDFHELLVLSATYQARTGKAIPIMLDAEAKIEAAGRLLASDRNRIWDWIRATVNEEHPLNHMGWGDNPAWSDEFNRMVERRRRCERDARIIAKHGGQP